MKNRDLVKRLRELDPDAEVVVWLYQSNKATSVARATLPAVSLITQTYGGEVRLYAALSDGEEIKKSRSKKLLSLLLEEPDET